MAIKLNRYKIKNPKKTLPKNYLVTETRYSNVRTQKVKLCPKKATTKWLGLSNEMPPVSINTRATPNIVTLVSYGANPAIV